MFANTPDDLEIPHTAHFHNGYIHDWTGVPCNKCRGVGQHAYGDTCGGCGGAGEGYGEVWRWEE